MTSVIVNLNIKNDMQNQTINLTSLRPGRIASWVYETDSLTYAKNKANKGGRNGVAPNPLYGEVSVRRVYSGQVATHQMYVNAWEKLHPGQAYAPDPTRTARFEATEWPTVVKSTATQDLQVRIMNINEVKETYFVNGQVANEEQLKTIEMYERVRERKPSDVSIMFPYVHNLTNVIDPE